MNLALEYFENFERPWLLKRLDGEYGQHSHFYSKDEALRVKNLLEIGKYPKTKEQKMAMLRILSEEEFKSLDKKQRYFNPCKGVRNKK